MDGGYEGITAERDQGTSIAAQSNIAAVNLKQLLFIVLKWLVKPLPTALIQRYKNVEPRKMKRKVVIKFVMRTINWEKGGGRSPKPPFEADERRKE